MINIKSCILTRLTLLVVVLFFVVFNHIHFIKRLGSEVDYSSQHLQMKLAPNDVVEFNHFYL